MMDDGKITYLIFADGSEEFARSMRYAALKARKNNAKVAVLGVLGEQGFQHWGTIEERIKAEQRAQAEKDLAEVALRIEEIGGIKPSVDIMEGPKTDAVLAMVEKDRSIVKLIVTSSVSKMEHGPLLAYFTGKGAHLLPITLTVVPGHLPEDEIDKLV